MSVAPVLPEVPRRGPGRPKGVKRAKADGTVEIDPDGSIDINLRASQFDIKNKQPGMDYRWVLDPEVNRRRIQHWVPCTDDRVITAARNALDPTKVGSVHKTNKHTLMERPTRIGDMYRRKQREIVDQTETKALARMKVQGAMATPSMQVSDDVIDLDDSEYEGGEGTPLLD